MMKNSTSYNIQVWEKNFEYWWDLDIYFTLKQAKKEFLKAQKVHPIEKLRLVKVDKITTIISN